MVPARSVSNKLGIGRCCRCTTSGGGSGCDLGDRRTMLVVDVGVLMEEIFSPERAGFM